MSKLIYSNDRIGEIKGSFVNNDITGVFGEVGINIETDERMLFEQIYEGLPNLNYTNPFVNIVPPTPPGYTNTNKEITFNSFDIDIDLDFIKPTKINNILIEVEYWQTMFSYQNIGSMTVSNAQAAFNSIGADARDIANNLYFKNTSIWGGMIPESQIRNVLSVVNYDFPNPQHSFKFLYSSKINLPTDFDNRNGIFVHASYFSGNLDFTIRNDYHGDDVLENSHTIYPAYVKVTLTGTDIEQNTLQYAFGTKTNALELTNNPLVTTRTSIGGIPFYQYRADKIINEWRNGKRALNIEAVAPQDLYQIQDSVKILEARRGEIDENNPQEVNAASALATENGTAADMEITSAEFRYNGAVRQILDVLEKPK